jgi:hypothetical protein
VGYRAHCLSGVHNTKLSFPRHCRTSSVCRLRGGEGSGGGHWFSSELSGLSGEWQRFMSGCQRDQGARIPGGQTGPAFGFAMLPDGPKMGTFLLLQSMPRRVGHTFLFRQSVPRWIRRTFLFRKSCAFLEVWLPQPPRMQGVSGAAGPADPQGRQRFLGGRLTALFCEFLRFVAGCVCLFRSGCQAFRSDRQCWRPDYHALRPKDPSRGIAAFFDTGRGSGQKAPPWINLLKDRGGARPNVGSAGRNLRAAGTSANPHECLIPGRWASGREAAK